MKLPYSPPKIIQNQGRFHRSGVSGWKRLNKPRSCEHSFHSEAMACVVISSRLHFLSLRFHKGTNVTLLNWLGKKFAAMLSCTCFPPEDLGSKYNWTKCRWLLLPLAEYLTAWMFLLLFWSAERIQEMLPWLTRNRQVGCWSHGRTYP